MEVSRLISGNTPFITNIPVYLATTVNGLKRGAVVAVGATGAARGATLSVATTTAAAKDVIGVLNLDASFAYQTEKEGTNGHYANSFRIQSDLIADRGADEGNDWLPAVVNPDALFLSWYSTTQAAATAGDTITQSITASTGTSVTIASLDQDQIGGWLFSVKSNSVGDATYYGALRYISTATQTGLVGLLTAMNLSTDSSLILMAPWATRSTIINDDGRYLRSQGGAGLKLAQGIVTWDNYGQWDGAPLHPLRSWMDNGLNSLNNAKFYAEIFLFDWSIQNESIA